MLPQAQSSRGDRSQEERFRHGEAAAFDQIVRDHRRAVYLMARRLLDSHDEADEAAQVAFVRAWQARARFRGASSIRTWLIRIALNVAKSMQTSRRPALGVESLDNVPDGSDRSDERIRRRQLRQRVREARIGALRVHASSCAECAGTDDLLEFLGLPASERDLVERPDESYWKELQTRVVRSARDADSAAVPTRRAAWAAVAAVLLAVAIGLWSLDGFSSGRGVPAGPGSHSTEQLPPQLDDLLRNAAPEEALAGLDFLAGLPGVEGTAPRLGGGRAEPAVSLRGDGWILPVVDQMDAESRDALLEWLQERTAVERGVKS